MKEITCAQIASAVEKLCVKAAVWLPADMAMQIECAADCEVSPEGAAALNDIIDNYKFAAEKNLPICQDTGMAVIFAQVGQDVHITGGGFYENIPRMLPEGIRAFVEKDSYEVPAIFKLLQKKGNIAEEMMYNTYNMGLGMVLAVEQEDVDKTMAAILAAGDTPYIVGKCKTGEKGVTLC